MNMLIIMDRMPPIVVAIKDCFDELMFCCTAQADSLTLLTSISCKACDCNDGLKADR
ncbi:hypothetical protein T4C_8695 [Trichinella pseudospiralis]|uniref:Uncharacterized protein n=1 Tax=Trichinella pseudospiralis TaxID=6337 RepID=A0A0V1K8Y2_TRIPS|nr:hypothetical protein T4C_8695 [Trichinella pseudospiralis]